MNGEVASKHAVDTAFDDQVNAASKTADNLFTGLSRIIRGRSDTVKLVLTALLADGHVLLEDYPGSGKTTLSKALGALISHSGCETKIPIAGFKRIQFTPDMLPGDILGVTVFEPKSASFNFMPGPIFAHIILADEINRTGPKVQAAFLECMAEKQVTVDNQTYALDQLFFVIGTQNPLDIAGTYPLPLVQLDRFLMRIPMAYVDASTELEILEQHSSISEDLRSITPVCSRAELISAQQAARNVSVHPAIRSCIVQIVQATRSSPEFQFGLSTRSAIMLQSASQAFAIINGRTYCTEDDLKSVLPYVLSHRLSTHGSARESIRLIEKVAEPFLEKLISARI